MRQSERDIQRDRSFDGDRWQSETPSRAPDQNVDARSETHADLSRGTDVFASKGSRRRAGGGREHGPAQLAACRNADIDTYGIKRALIELYGEWRVLNETALHGLMAEDDEADAWVELARQPSYLRPRLGRLGHCRLNACQESRCEDQGSKHFRSPWRDYWRTSRVVRCLSSKAAACRRHAA